jgi:hypothetical protein
MTIAQPADPTRSALSFLGAPLFVVGLLAPKLSELSRRSAGFAGRRSAQGRNRTSDTGFFRPVLCQLSYLGWWFYAPATGLEPATFTLTG